MRRPPPSLGHLHFERAGLAWASLFKEIVWKAVAPEPALGGCIGLCFIETYQYMKPLTHDWEGIPNCHARVTLIWEKPYESKLRSAVQSPLIHERRSPSEIAACLYTSVDFASDGGNESVKLCAKEDN